MVVEENYIHMAVEEICIRLWEMVSNMVVVENCIHMVVEETCTLP